MKGRFEQPRNSRRSAPPRQQAPYSRNDYEENTGYTSNPYENAPYEESYDSSSGNYDNYAGYGGEYDAGGYDQNNFPQEGRGWGWGILGFFLPLVGLILWLVWKRKKPRSARASGIGALIGFIVSLILTLVLVIGGAM